MAEDEKNEIEEPEAPAEAEAEPAAPEAEAAQDEPEASAGEADAGSDEAPAEEPEPEASEEAPAEEPAPAAEEAPAAEKPKPARKARAPKPKAEAKAKAKPKARASAKRTSERKPIVRLPKPERVRGKRKERRGVVVSNAMDKTIVVRVDTVRPHRAYKKVVRRSQKFHAHDELNQANVGDVVRIVETRPLAKTKSWRLAEIIEVAK
jgi:small subunit ribosomal protein S17